MLENSALLAGGAAAISCAEAGGGYALRASLDTQHVVLLMNFAKKSCNVLLYLLEGLLYNADMRLAPGLEDARERLRSRYKPCGEHAFFCNESLPTRRTDIECPQQARNYYAC